MKKLLSSMFLLLMLLFAVGATPAHGQVSVGIVIGAPPPPPPRVVVVPARPAPDFVFVDGYWYPVGHHYRWHPGYWTRPPYEDAHWVVPHHDGERYYGGYWEGGHGRIEHDHHWDRHHDRDWHHERDDHDDRDDHHDGDDHHRHHDHDR